MNRIVISLIACSWVFSMVCVAEDPAVADQIVPLWPEAPPQWIAPQQRERDTTGSDGRRVADQRVTRLGFVSKPELHVFHASGDSSDTAVLICPGGGYSILAWDLEGTEIAQWLQRKGVTGIVVKYRVPTRKNDPNWLAPVQDIQRGLSLVSSGAIEGVSAKHLGVLRFSAGGNAAARVATATMRHYEPTDQHDRGNYQPDFAVLIYPAWLIREDDPNQLIDAIEVTSQTPPMFFAHAADDRVDCMSSVSLFSALKRNQVPSSLHVFASGGHGFGGRIAGSPTDAWKGLCETWMQNQDWMGR